jgi:hypothetical protein
VDIPFKFIAAGKVHQPGAYEVQVSDSQAVLTLIPHKRKEAASTLLVLTRLAAPATPLTEGRVVFDKAGDRYYLSELWVPGLDGFLTHAEKGAHTHQAIKIDRKAS